MGDSGRILLTIQTRIVFLNPGGSGVLARRFCRDSAKLARIVLSCRCASRGATTLDSAILVRAILPPLLIFLTTVSLYLLSCITNLTYTTRALRVCPFPPQSARIFAGFQLIWKGSYMW